MLWIFGTYFMTDHTYIYRTGENTNERTGTTLLHFSRNGCTFFFFFVSVGLSVAHHNAQYYNSSQNLITIGCRISRTHLPPKFSHDKRASSSAVQQLVGRCLFYVLQ